VNLKAFFKNKKEPLVTSWFTEMLYSREPGWAFFVFPFKFLILEIPLLRPVPKRIFQRRKSRNIPGLPSEKPPCSSWVQIQREEILNPKP